MLLCDEVHTTLSRLSYSNSNEVQRRGANDLQMRRAVAHLSTARKVIFQTALLYMDSPEWKRATHKKMPLRPMATPTASAARSASG